MGWHSFKDLAWKGFDSFVSYILLTIYRSICFYRFPSLFLFLLFLFFSLSLPLSLSLSHTHTRRHTHFLPLVSTSRLLPWHLIDRRCIFYRNTTSFHLKFIPPPCLPVLSIWKSFCVRLSSASPTKLVIHIQHSSGQIEIHSFLLQPVVWMSFRDWRHVVFYCITNDSRQVRIMNFTYLNVSIVNGRYDLWLRGSSMDVPQKSLYRKSQVPTVGSVMSRLPVIALRSSCTKSPSSELQ